MTNKYVLNFFLKGQEVLDEDPKFYPSVHYRDLHQFSENLTVMKLSLAELSPEEREEARWSDEFYRRTKAMDDFWTAQNEERGDVLELLRLI